MSLDEIEDAVGKYDPYAAEDFSAIEVSKQEPLPEFLSAKEMLPAEPGEMPETLSTSEMFPTPELQALGDMVELGGKGAKLVGKGAWKALGVLSWPFRRIEAGIATPSTALLKALGVHHGMKRHIEEKVFYPSELNKTDYKNKIRERLAPHVFEMLGEEKVESMLEDFANETFDGKIPYEEPEKALFETKEAWSEVLPAFYHGAKSFVPFTRNEPEKVKNFNDMWAGYYEAITNEQAPEWFQQMSGIATSFLVTPTIFGKILKGIRAGGLKIPAIKRLANRKLPDWEKAKLTRKANIYERSKRSEDLGKKLANKDVKRIAKEMSLKTGKNISPEAVKLRLGQIIKGSVTEQESMAAVANPIIEEFTHNFGELQKLGILGPETFLTKLSKKRVADLIEKRSKLQVTLDKLKTGKIVSAKTGKEITRRFPGKAAKMRQIQNRIDDIDTKLQATYKTGGEQYMPRMYETKEAEAAARKFPVKGGPKVRAPYAKARKEIPLEVRKEMGEILEPSYPVTKRLIQEAQDIETSKLFKFAAERGDWVDDVWHSGLAKKALPDTKSYGALRGKFVAKQIHNDVTELVRIRSDFEAFYDSLIGSWKLGKVVVNPATHFRNTISNSILLDLSGTDHIAQSRLLIRALKEMKAGSKEFRTAQKYFARTTLISGELLDDMLRSVQRVEGTGLRRTINSWNTIMSKATGAPAKIYQQEEFIFKFMKYLEQREKGKSILGAVQEGNKWLFDYSDLSRFEKVVARRAMPFYTFQRKALPRVLEAAAERPLTLAKYPLLAWAEEKYALHKLELTEKDYAQIQKVLPEYMQRGSYILMPFRDVNGDLRFFDWTYIVPWGELFDAQDRGLLSTTVTNPLFQIVADITRNKSGWSGREIYKGTDTQKEKTFKQMVHLWQTAVPSLMYKGIYWDKIYESATGKPSKMGKIRPLAPTIAHTVFGLRTQPIDVAEQEKFRLMEKREEVQELEGKIRDIVIRLNAGNIDEEEYTKRRDQYFKQIQELLQND